jgi:hypothetical protein
VAIPLSDALGSAGLIAAGYVVGGLPLAPALARKSGVDPGRERDLHIALWHHASKRRASIAAAGDLFKGVIPPAIGYVVALPAAVAAFSGVAATAGQMWPAYGGHRGEGGNSVGVGMLLSVSMLYGAYLTLLSLVFFATGALLRYLCLRSSDLRRRRADHPMSLCLPLGMFLGFGLAPLFSVWSGVSRGMAWAFAALFLLIALRRVLAGGMQGIGRRGPTVLLSRLLFDQDRVG